MTIIDIGLYFLGHFVLFDQWGFVKEW
jgi:hypothetical protein